MRPALFAIAALGVLITGPAAAQAMIRIIRRAALWRPDRRRPHRLRLRIDPQCPGDGVGAPGDMRDQSVLCRPEKAAEEPRPEAPPAGILAAARAITPPRRFVP